MVLSLPSGIFAPLSKISKVKDGRKATTHTSSARAAPHTRSQKVDVAHVTSKVNSGRSRREGQHLLNHTSNRLWGASVWTASPWSLPPRRNLTKARPLWFGPHLWMWLKSLIMVSFHPHVFLCFKCPMIRLGAGSSEPYASSELVTPTVAQRGLVLLRGLPLLTCPVAHLRPLFPLSLLTCGQLWATVVAVGGRGDCEQLWAAVGGRGWP